MTILGLGGLLNDPACAIVKDGELAAAVQQIKVAHGFQRGAVPQEAISAALRLAKVDALSLDCVALVRPFSTGPESGIHLALRAQFPNSRLVLVEHQLAHAASAFYVSPFEEANVLTLDREGDFRCGSLYRGKGNRLELDRELYFPDSLGALYGRVTELLGYRQNADEHIVQWLSRGAVPQHAGVFEEIIGGPWPSFDQSWFDSNRLDQGGFSSRFYHALDLKEGAPVPAERRAEIAASLQSAIENAVLRMAGDAPNLCLAGGLAFNTLLVAALEKHKNVFVQPAAGNAGTAIGAVLYAWHNVYDQRARVPLRTLALGPSYTQEEIKQVLENCKLRFRYLLTSDELVETAVREINENKIVAWMQGRMEFGPRALGNRSILASPLNPYSSENLNAFIKHREPFRKFAASVPAEAASEYFDVGPNARFLGTTGTVRPQHRKTFEPAVFGSHGLIRVHTVDRAENPLFHRLLTAAGKRTGLPVVYNTSFNLFKDPLVCTPRDAVRSFYSSGLDTLFAGNFLVEK